MSFKAFSTLCCGKGSHKTILGQIYISASCFTLSSEKKKIKQFWVFASLSFPYWGLQCPDISILGKHGKTRTCISLSYPLMLMSVKEIISSWFTSLLSTKGSNWLWNTWMVILHFLWYSYTVLQMFRQFSLFMM